jgi:hypothetical protein
MQMTHTDGKGHALDEDDDGWASEYEYYMPAVQYG